MELIFVFFLKKDMQISITILQIHRNMYRNNNYEFIELLKVLIENQKPRNYERKIYEKNKNRSL